MKNLIILISFSLLMITAPAQVVHFPACEDLMVTKMQFDQTTGNDTLYVTVHNDCDTCDQNVYTGILVVINDDTLATTRTLSGEVSPTNNSSSTYSLYLKNGEFGLSTSLKVEMRSICDSIPFAPDVILSLKEERIKDKKKVFLQNNSILTSQPGQAIKDVSVYSLSGQLVKKETGIFSSNYVLMQNKPGIYIVSVKLTSNEVVNLKYVNTTK